MISKNYSRKFVARQAAKGPCRKTYRVDRARWFHHMKGEDREKLDSPGSFFGRPEYEVFLGGE